MNLLETRQLADSSVLRICKVHPVGASGVQALLSDELAHVVISVDLVDVAVLVTVRAVGSVCAQFSCEERFTVLIASSDHFFSF